MILSYFALLRSFKEVGVYKMAGILERLKTSFLTGIEWLADREAVRAAMPKRRNTPVLRIAHYNLGIRDKEGKLQSAGAVILELYVAAKAGKLRWQIENDEERLKHPDGTLKTPLELAMVPSKVKNGQIKQPSASDVKNYFKAAQKGTTLPAPINKLRIEPEFFSELSKTNFVPYEGSLPGAEDDQVMNFKIHDSTPFERLLHYTMQKTGVFLAAFAGVSFATSLGLAFPPAIALSFVFGYMVNYAGKAFTTFDLAEFIIRDTRWMFDKAYAWDGKWSWAKTKQALPYFMGAALAVYTATTEVWAATMGASVWSSMAALGLSATAITGAAIFTAVVTTFVAASIAWFGASYAARYFHPFTIFDNTIDPKEFQEIEARVLARLEEYAGHSNDEVLSSSPSLTPSRDRQVEEARNDAHNDAEKEPAAKTGSSPMRPSN